MWSALIIAGLLLAVVLVGVQAAVLAREERPSRGDRVLARRIRREHARRRRQTRRYLQKHERAER